VNILAIDPGTHQSAYVELTDGKITSFGKVPNTELLHLLRLSNPLQYDAVVFEQVKAYEHIGDDALWTVHWCGRFHQVALHCAIDIVYVPRSTVKVHVTGHNRTARDSHVRMAMLDRWGPQKLPMTDEEQEGVPKSKRKRLKPGPTAGIRADMWAALSVATWYLDTGGKA
jgi:hypothetical protein